ncbi:MAG: class I SAM-dependent methyltransferase [Boseongicola sp.]
MSHQLEKEFQDSYYSDDADVILKSKLMQLRRHRVARLLNQAFQNPKKTSILSLGCGNGETELQVANDFEHITGIDLSEVAIAMADEKKEISKSANARFLVGDCTELSVEDLGGDIDAVWALGFLHHVNEAEMRKIVAQSFGLLNSSGIMMSIDPNKFRIVGLLKFLVRKKIQAHQSPDEQELDPRKLRQIYLDAGFTKVSISYVDFFSGPFAWVFPRHSALIARLVWMLDRALVSCPGIRHFSSTFHIVAEKK